LMNICEQIRKEVKSIIDSLHLTIDESQVEVARTADFKNGDYSTNVAMKIAKVTKVSNVSKGTNAEGKKTSKTSETFETSETSKSKQSPVEIAKKLADSEFVLGIRYYEYQR